MSLFPTRPIGERTLTYHRALRDAAEEYGLQVRSNTDGPDDLLEIFEETRTRILRRTRRKVVGYLRRSELDELLLSFVPADPGKCLIACTYPKLEPVLRDIERSVRRSWSTLDQTTTAS